MRYIKFLLLLISVFYFLTATGQKGIEGLIQAEKKFAAWSVEHGTREAFLQFMDSSAIVFEKGQPVNARQLWTSRDTRPGILNWHPNRAEISVSGDFGYTTGPWTFRNSLKDTVIASGYFTSIWQKDGNGEWKFILDMGVSGTPASKADTLTERKRNPSPGYFLKGTTASLVQTDSIFGATGKITGKKGKILSPSPDYWLNRNGQVSGNKRNVDSSFSFKILGSGLSPSGDLGFVYGRVITEGKADNFLRIWRREGSHWKLVLEVLRV